jgi:hypothetical protein
LNILATKGIIEQGDIMIKYYPESIIVGAILLTIGLVFGGFSNNNVPTADAHENEVVRLIAAIEASKLAALPEPVSFERAYANDEQLAPEELRDLLYSVGFRGEALRQAWGTAMKESTGRPMAHNKNSNTGDNSYGLFQINMIGSLGPARMEHFGLSSYEDLFNPVINANIAFQMSNEGNNWKAWHGITDRTKEWMSQFPVEGK